MSGRQAQVLKSLMQGEDELVVEPMRWGLIPSYTKADTIEEVACPAPHATSKSSDLNYETRP